MVKQEIKSYSLKRMLHLDHAYEKSITHLWTMQKILIFFLPMYNLLEYSYNYSAASGRL